MNRIALRAGREREVVWLLNQGKRETTMVANKRAHIRVRVWEGELQNYKKEDRIRTKRIKTQAGLPG